MNKFTPQEISWWPVYYAREMIQNSMDTLMSGVAIVAFAALGSLPEMSVAGLVIVAISGYLLGILLLWLTDKQQWESSGAILLILTICWGAVIGCPLGIFVYALWYG